MLQAFFTNQGLIYMHTVPSGTTINNMYIIKVLGNFMQ
jgi:hypothetical protein